MDKLSRVRSIDPVQDELRSAKTDWNIDVSQFIQTLIMLKKAMNGQPIVTLGLDRTPIRMSFSDRIPQLINLLARQYEEITRNALDIVRDQDDYSDMRKSASNALSRLMFYAKNPFDFSKQNRWEKKRILQSSADLFYLIQKIESSILTRSDKSIPESIFNTKLFIRNMLNDLCVPLLSIYEKENSHLISIVKELDARVQKIEEKIKTISPKEISDVISVIRELIKQYKYQSGSYRLLEAVDTFEKLDGIMSSLTAGAMISNANVVDRWVKKKYLQFNRKEDSSLRIAAADVGAKIRLNLNELMSAIQEDDEVSSLSRIIVKLISDSIEFIEYLEKLSDMHSNFINLKKNDGEKNKTMFIPARDLSYIKQMKGELKESLVKFQGMAS